MTAPEVKGAPADEAYNAMSRRCREAENSAGAMLAQSLRSDDSPFPAKARAMAEEYAREANEARAEMKAWRLANGWPS